MKIRTKEELELTEYNYYVLFKINPNEASASEIQKAINNEKNKWVQGLPIQRRFKELYEDAVSVMINDVSMDPLTGRCVPGARARELENARKLKLNDAKILVSSLAKRGRIYKSELLQIADADRNKWFGVQELEAYAYLLVPQGVQYIDDTQTLFDFKKYKEIEKLIVFSQAKTLYELLALDSTSPISAFASAINSVSQKNEAIKTTPKGVAIGIALDIARDIFADEKSKRAYDDYLKIKESVWDELEQRRSSKVKAITIAEFVSYARAIETTLGMPSYEAQVWVSVGLKEFKLVVEGVISPESAMGGLDFVFDAKTYDDINKHLFIAGASDVYELIGLNQFSMLGEIGGAIENKRKISAVEACTPQGAARVNVLSIAKRLFQSEQSKKGYDNYLKIKNSVWDELKHRQRYRIKEMSCEEQSYYSRIIKSSIGVSCEVATELLFNMMKHFGLCVNPNI